MRKRCAPLLLLALLAPASAMALSTITGYGHSQQAAYQNVVEQITPHCRGVGYITQIQYSTHSGGVYATAWVQCGKGLTPITGW